METIRVVFLLNQGKPQVSTLEMTQRSGSELKQFQMPKTTLPLNAIGWDLDEIQNKQEKLCFHFN